MCTQASESPTDNFWQYNLEIPINRFNYNAIAVNDKIYVFYYDRAIMYDPLTGKYNDIPSNPAQRIYFATAAVGNKIYLMGGEIFAQSKTSINQAYDTQTGTWEPKSALPQTSDYITANAIDGKIYVIGAESTPVQVYDPSTDSWEIKNPSPHSLERHISCNIDEKIYVLNDGNLYIYNTKTDSWSTGAIPPKKFELAPNSGSTSNPGMAGSGIAATTGTYAPKRIYVMGGYETVSFYYSEARDYNYFYDPFSDSWESAASMLTPVGSFAAAVVNDKIYVLGGWTNTNPQITGEVQVYTPFGYSSTPLVTRSSPSGSDGFNLSSLAVVVGVAIAAVIIAAVSIAVIYFRHAPTKAAKTS
jgi:hypothetical protein